MSTQAYTAAAEFRRTGVARALVDMLEKRLEELKSSLIIASDKEFYKLQGRASEVMALINAIKSEN